MGEGLVLCEHKRMSDHGAAVAITRRNEARRGVLAEQRGHTRRVDAIARGQRAAGIAAVGGITERRVC